MKRLLFYIFAILLSVNAFSQSKHLLYIRVSPEDATLEINGQVKPTANGVYQELLPYGEYNYKVYKEGYSIKTGSIKILNGNDTNNLEVKLKKPHGYISILNNQNISGASIYIDDSYVGDFPVKDVKIKSGTHQLTIKHPIYKTYSTVIELNDEEYKTVAPPLAKSHVIVTLETQDNAEIFVNDEVAGNGKCQDTLLIGARYKFESRMPGYAPSALYRTIGLNDQNRVITVPDPTPIYGKLKISSAFPDADIYLDGNYIGKTPLTLSKILTGKHCITANYRDYKSSQTINITDEECVEISFELPNCTLALSSTPAKAQIFLDGNHIGSTPKYIPQLWPGEHTVRFEYNDNWFESQTKTVNIENGEHLDLSLEKACGSLYVTSNPSNARVFIDNKEVGETPLQMQSIWEGEHKVTVKYNYGETQTQTINIIQGQEQNLNFEKTFSNLYVTSVPNDAKVFIDGKCQGVTPLRVVGVEEGEHLIKVELQSYDPQTREISIKPGEDDNLSFLLNASEPTCKELIFRVEDDSSEIWIDNNLMGKGEVKCTLAYGVHNVECRKEYYKSTIVSIFVDKTSNDTIILKSPSCILNNTIKITSNQDRAFVFIDGKFAGMTPYQNEIRMGTHLVELKKFGYNDAHTTVLVSEGAPTSVNLTLNSDCYLSISSTPKARFYLDDRYRGTTPCWGINTKLGLHKINLTAEGYVQKNRWIYLTDKSNNSFHYNLRKEKSVQSDSKIYSTKNDWVRTEEYYYDWSDDELDWGPKILEWSFNLQPGIGNSFFGVEFSYYITRFIFGCSLQFGLHKTDEVQLIDPEVDKMYLSKQLRPNTTAFKTGYVFLIGNRCTLTPIATIGMQYLSTDWTEEEADAYLDANPITIVNEEGRVIARYKNTEDYGDETFYCSAGLRLGYAIVKHIELNLTTSYCYTGEGYGIYYKACQQIPRLDNWTNGLKIQFGCSFYL